MLFIRAVEKLKYSNLRYYSFKCSNKMDDTLPF